MGELSSGTWEWIDIGGLGGGGGSLLNMSEPGTHRDLDAEVQTKICQHMVRLGIHTRNLCTNQLAYGALRDEYIKVFLSPLS